MDIDRQIVIRKIDEYWIDRWIMDIYRRQIITYQRKPKLGQELYRLDSVELYGWIDSWIYRQIDGYLDRQIDRYLDRQIDIQIDRQILTYQRKPQLIQELVQLASAELYGQIDRKMDIQIERRIYIDR